MVARYLTWSDLITFVAYGGLAGPILLAISFSLGSDAHADAQWLLWIGIACTVLALIMVFARSRSRSKSSAQTELLEQQGVLGLAEVVSLTETNETINEAPVVKLGLHISGPNLTPFNAQQHVRVSPTRQSMITGRKLVVLVDPTDNSYQIDWGRSAVISGVVPSVIRSAEDNRTYDLTGQVGPLMEFLQVLKSNRLPYDSYLDLRANPDVREQVLRVARRAGAAQHAPAAPAPSAAQRMQNLETLRATGAISEAEYAEKRQQIIRSL